MVDSSLLSLPDELLLKVVEYVALGSITDLAMSQVNMQATQPVDVYEFLRSTATLPKTKAVVRATSSLPKSDKFTVQPFPLLDTALSKAVKTLDGKGLTRSQLRMIFTWDDIEKLSRSLKRILYK